MSTIAEVELPAAEFALRRTLSEHPSVDFEIVRIAVHDKDHLMPYVRAAGDELDGLARSLESDPSIEEAYLLDELADERLYRMNWVEQIQVVIHAIVEQGAAVVEMHGRDERWFLRILFPTRDALSATHDYCSENGLTFEIRNIYELDGSVGQGEFGLTDDQYQALVAAAERGYFDVPRRTTMGELAAELGVSQQALSERLRRGHRALINSALRARESPLE